MNEVVKIISDVVESNRKLIFDTTDYIWNNPETGYKEKKTSKYLEDVFVSLGYEVTKAGDIPGFVTQIDTGRKGPEILILAELDSLVCYNHKDADKTTGAVHCCGHNAQCGAMVGIAAALKEEKILNKLCGKIRLCLVPAEELIEIEYRKQLKEQGAINFFGGKAEFLRRGLFDGVDMAFMVHTTPNESFLVNNGGVGCLVKRITFKGKSAHAGGNPWDGVNALYAATQGLSAINAIRETFKEKDIVRVHPIMTSGGSVVSAIPETATLETFIRGSSFDAIFDTNKKVNRALVGGALSLGANVEIEDIPGYAPYLNDTSLIDVFDESLTELFNDRKLLRTNVINSGSTDMGDLCCVMPMIHPYAPGATGISHGANYYIIDKEKACVDSAKWQLVCLYNLLKNNAEKGLKIIKEYKPLFSSKKEYIDFLNGVFKDEDMINYNSDGTIAIKI